MASPDILQDIFPPVFSPRAPPSPLNTALFLSPFSSVSHEHGARAAVNATRLAKLRTGTAVPACEPLVYLWLRLPPARGLLLLITELASGEVVTEVCWEPWGGC